MAKCCSLLDLAVLVATWGFKLDLVAVDAVATLRFAPVREEARQAVVIWR